MLKKDWPTDAVMIVAANAGEELRENMEAALPQTCRDCGTRLMADTHTIRKAQSLPSCHGRPVKFFCIQCAMQYGRPEEIYDDRNHA